GSTNYETTTDLIGTYSRIIDENGYSLDDDLRQDVVGIHVAFDRMDTAILQRLVRQRPVKTVQVYQIRGELQKIVTQGKQFFHQAKDPKEHFQDQLNAKALSVGCDVALVAKVESLKNLFKGIVDEEQAEKYAKIFFGCYSPSFIVKADGISLRDLVTAENMPSAIDMFSLLAKAMCEDDFAESPHINFDQESLLSDYPALVKDASRTFVGKLRALIFVDSEHIAQRRRQKDNFTVNIGNNTIDLASNMFNLQNEFRETLISPDSPNFAESAKKVVELLNTYPDSGALIFPLLRFRDTKHVRDYYRDLKALASNEASPPECGRIFEEFDKVLMPISDYGIVRARDLSFLLSEDHENDEVAVRPDFAGLKETFDTYGQDLKGKQYWVSQEQEMPLPFLKNEGIRISFDSATHDKFGVLFRFDDLNGNKKILTFAADLSNQKFDWNAVEYPDEAPALWNELYHSTSRCMFGLVDELLVSHPEVEMDLTPVENLPMTRDPIYDLRKDARRGIAQAQPDTTEVRSSKEKVKVPNIIDLPEETDREGLTALFKKCGLPFGELEIVMQTIRKKNVDRNLELRKLEGSDQIFEYSTKIGNKAIRVMCSSGISSGNGERHFKVEYIDYHTRAIQKVGGTLRRGK
ncbi:MAG TPA: hypothetical protein VG965_06400, partial [Patescibacteria group bacterium]|nr:hypothetical protein [Patescibacteria group bacterium]